MKAMLPGLAGIIIAVGAIGFAYMKDKAQSENHKALDDRRQQDVKELRAAAEASRKQADDKMDAQVKTLNDIKAELHSQLDGQGRELAEAKKQIADLSVQVDALARPGRVKKAVEERPTEFIGIPSSSVFDPGIVNTYVALSAIEIANKSDADVIWVELRVTYYQGSKEVGSKVFDLGDASARNPEKVLLPRSRTIKGYWHGHQPVPGERRGFTFDAAKTQIAGGGRDARAEIMVQRVKVLD